MKKGKDLKKHYNMTYTRSEVEEMINNLNEANGDELEITISEDRVKVWSLK